MQQQPPRNTSLDAFGTDGPSVESVANCAITRPVPERIAWERPDKEWGLRTRRPASSVITSGTTLCASPQQVRWIVDGDVGAYVEQYGDDETGFWGVPDTYGAFDSVDTYVGRVDGLADRYGWGINGSALERAVRILVDGGRYQTDRYRVDALENWFEEGQLGMTSAHVVLGPTGGLNTAVVRSRFADSRSYQSFSELTRAIARMN